MAQYLEPSVLVFWLPSVLLFIVAITYAVGKWRIHPRLSFLVLIGLLLSAFREIAWLLYCKHIKDISQLVIPSSISTVYAVSSFIPASILLFACFYGFHEGQHKNGRRNSTLSEN